MTIHIEELTFEAIIGILEFERVNVQTIIVNAEIDYLFENNDFINYADVINLIETDMKENKYELLESAMENLHKKIILKYPKIQRFQLKITKPNIIKNAQVSLSETWFNS